MTKHTRQLDLFRQQPPPLRPRDRTYGLVVRPPQPCRCGCDLAVVVTEKARMPPPCAVPSAMCIAVGCRTLRTNLSPKLSTDLGDR